jgi:hypothetical protein
MSTFSYQAPVVRSCRGPLALPPHSWRWQNSEFVRRRYKPHGDTHWCLGGLVDCPRCSGLLDTLDLGHYAGEYPDVTIDRCPACGGAWYEHGELDASDESPWTDVEACNSRKR